MRISLKDIQHIYFCTGARNEKLLSYFDPAKVSFEIDERMESFKALGRAKALNAPVAICTTSGTAVSECVSALIEAKYSNVPLILISGDRPKKLHHTGSPQTINHQILTMFLENDFSEISIDELQDLSWIQKSGPKHLNILIDDTISHNEKIKVHDDFRGFLHFLKNKKRPLFLFSHEEVSMRKFIEKFKLLDIPYYAETLSGGRELSQFTTEKNLTSHLSRFDSVIRIGHTPLSKIWRLLEKRPLPVFSFDNRGFSGLSFGEVFKASSCELLNNETFWQVLKEHPFHWGELTTSHNLDELLLKFSESEPAMMKKLQDIIPENANIYLGNSLVIRFFELTQHKNFHLFGNRGVNGIDGQLATAIGMAESFKGPLFCILGDLTTKYDLSSLEYLPSNLKLIIINNLGGRIFEMLKLNPQIILPHDKNFKDISHAFNLYYSNKLDDLFTHQVIELFPNQIETNLFLKEWEK